MTPVPQVLMEISGNYTVYTEGLALLVGVGAVVTELSPGSQAHPVYHCGWCCVKITQWHY